MQVQSPVFKQEGMIPPKYTCDGPDISPPLKWGQIPPGARSLALIVEDPDAPSGTFTHWVIYDIPAGISGLPERVPNIKTLSSGGKQGTNSFKKVGYGGPCPPSGTHRYYFRLYALDTVLNLGPGASKEELLKAMKGHILAEGELMGKYKKQ